jgi:hypothetical protein
MTLSKELQAQMDRFKKTRSCSLGSELKNELAILLFDIKGTRLNKSCGTCIRNAMQDVLNFISHEVRIEEFIGVRHERANTPDNKKKPDEETLKKEKEQAAKLMETLDKMSYKELKAYAGVKGNIKREKIYEILHLRSK